MKTKYIAPTINLLEEQAGEVKFKDALNSIDQLNKTNFCLGKNEKYISYDLTNLENSFIFGESNSGKSMFIHTLLLTLLTKNNPEDLKLFLYDPKQIELTCYENIPHLLTPVTSDSNVFNILDLLLKEVNTRIEMFKNNNVNNLEEFNNLKTNNLPKILIVLDEVFDMISEDKERTLNLLTALKDSYKVGVQIICSTQGITITKDLINLYNTNIVFKTKNEEHSLICKCENAHNFNLDGEMIFKKCNETIQCQGVYIDSNNMYNMTDFLQDNNNPDYTY